MGWPLVLAVLLGALVPSAAQEPPLPSRELPPMVLTVPGLEPMSFDLLDFRTEAQAPPPKSDPGHTHFTIKHHVGIAAGWDNQVLHGSLGMYVTMVEWGRWNFGAPTVELGLGRYPVYNRKTEREETSSQWTMFVSLASVHYRLGYIPSIGYHWYLNLEQILDLHTNLAGSQVGITFSRK